MKVCPNCGKNPNNLDPLPIKKCTNCQSYWCFHCEGYGTQKCPSCGNGASSPVQI